MTSSVPKQQEASGTFTCPICYEDTPHQHSGAEVHKYQAALIKRFGEQETRREAIATKIRAGLQKDLEQAMAALRSFDDGCYFCRMFNDHWVRRFIATVYVHEDYGLSKIGSALKCPKCDRHVWSDER